MLVAFVRGCWFCWEDDDDDDDDDDVVVVVVVVVVVAVVGRCSRFCSYV